jgi:hypothetical protein
MLRERIYYDNTSLYALLKHLILVVHPPGFDRFGLVDLTTPYWFKIEENMFRLNKYVDE